jgi:16S rRNA (adenine1518-N6/adenine1519-N6)-dimethyltransferase
MLLPMQPPLDLADPRTVGEVLSRHGIWLSKTMGQHLLVDRSVLRRIVAASGVTSNDEVLEIGPGAGVLTAELARNARRVVAVELDQRLLSVLRETVPAPNVEIVTADALDVDPRRLFSGRPFRVVANLPYGVATPLIRKFVTAPPESRPVEMVVMVQREVGRRLAAEPGDMSYLSVEVQLSADVDLLFEVPPDAFFPSPEVFSAVVQLTPLPEYRVPPLPAPQRFFQTVAAGFQQRRKQLHNALGVLGVGAERIAAALVAAQIDPHRRAETLSLDEWSRLSAALWAA